jgi:hypothetical protein
MAYDFNEEAERIGERIIPDWHPHLVDVKIAYIDKKQTSASAPKTRAGKALKLGSASRVSDKYKLLAARDYEFVIEITEAYWHKLSLPQQEALIDHELCHCRKDGDGFYIANHDLEEFRSVLRRHGFWKPDIQAFCEEAQPLFDKPGIQKRFVSNNGDAVVCAGQTVRVEETGDTWTYSVKDGAFVKVADETTVTITGNGESVTMTEGEFKHAAQMSKGVM